MALTLRYAVRSDLGLVRGNNEDSVYAGPRLLAIADGMGGHAAGEVASKIVIQTMEPLDDDTMRADLIGALRDAVLDANQRIAEAVEAEPKLDGMGTTLTALRFAGSQVALVHVGDSRAYLVRGNTLSQITHDDTYVQYLVDSGKLTEDEAKDHPRKSVILRALRGAEVDPDVSIREARAGDRYLLCSDGLSDVVSTETIFETLHIGDPQECADRLVELALRSGGPDNVTVIVADVVDSKPGDAVDDVPVRDGAFVDPAAADVLPTDSAAERAAAISRRRPAGTAESAQAEPAARKGRRWKLPLIVLITLVVLGGALGGTYAWAQTQYYVGRSGNEVAIYRGINASFGPLKFSEVYQNTGIKLSDLTPSYRSQVESGIVAHSRADATVIVGRLRDHRKPVCPPAGASSSGTSGVAGTSGPTSPSGSPGTTGTPVSPNSSRSRTSTAAGTHKSEVAGPPARVSPASRTGSLTGSRSTTVARSSSRAGTNSSVARGSGSRESVSGTPSGAPSAPDVSASASPTQAGPASGSPTESPCR